MKDSINTVSLALISRYAKENGLNINLRMTMDFAKFVLKIKMKKCQESVKTVMEIQYSIAKEPANKKVYRFKRLSTVQLDIVKDAMIT